MEMGNEKWWTLNRLRNNQKVGPDQNLWIFGIPIPHSLLDSTLQHLVVRGFISSSDTSCFAINIVIEQLKFSEKREWQLSCENLKNFQPVILKYQFA